MLYLSPLKTHQYPTNIFHNLDLDQGQVQKHIFLTAAY